MPKWNFYVPTVTQAMRGKTVLAAAGIPAFISRNTDMHAGEGCGYIIIVQQNNERAAAVLTNNNIKITRKETGR